MQISVVQSTNVWLSQTMTWLDTQVRFLPSRVRSHVVCDHTQNLDQFPVASLTSADRDSAAWRFVGARSWQVAKRRSVALRIQAAKRFGAQVIHSHFGDQGWTDLSAARRTGAKHVVTFYGYDVSRLPFAEPMWKDRYQALFAQAELFLCEGPHLAQCLIGLGCPAAKVKVHHLGLDLARIPFSPRSWQPGQPLRVLIAGSFTEKKGMPYAIEGLGRLRGKVDIEVTIIGDADHQERNKREKARILDALRSTGLESRTRLLGYRPYAAMLDEAYRNHVFLSPSVTASDGDTEGGAPVSVIEMAASGMPVVSTRHCDIPEVLEDGVTGLLTSERSVDGIAEKLDWLTMNQDRWEAMATAARRHVEKEFRAETQGCRLAEDYELLLQVQRTPPLE